VIHRCLAKDPADRWPNLRDLLLELKWAAQFSTPVAAPAGSFRGTLLWALLAAASFFLAAVILGLALISRSVPEPAHPVRFTIPLPPKSMAVSAGSATEISPDGRRLVFTADTAGVRMLYYRPLDGLVSQPLPGTEGA